ncbi:MAG: DUF2846 domain-containing protein [Bacteroidales bacterium]|jgi:hypothetical protein|nr:DUF2846 domain-containing protein [Bacteroidales bacterium]
MRKNIFILFGICALIISSCSPKVSTSISKTYDKLNSTEPIVVFGVDDAAPSNAEILGNLKIGESGLTVNCEFESVLALATDEARKIGGNAIKLTEHNTPSALGSSCHRIKADILRIDNIETFISTESSKDTSISDEYAVLHIYRQGGAGALVGYDLYLGDNVICRVKNKWRETIIIREEGRNTLWARTEAKAELPINIQFGKEYYIRCSITMGAFVGHPKIELVDSSVGKLEIKSIPIQ